MNYYDDLIENIEKHIKNNDYESAKLLIINELNLPYVPKDIEEKLNKYLLDIKSLNISFKTLTDEEIVLYLYSNEEKQLIAVDELSRRNLRDYIDICDKYLTSKGYANSKALLIDSLIRQEINYTFSIINNNSLLKFNPKNMQIIEETQEFKNACSYLTDYYLKDPSKLQMAIELLYKEAMLSLPKKIISKEITNRIICFIENAFSAK